MVPAQIGYAIGSGPNNAAPQVKVYDTSGSLLATFNAFPGFAGGVNVAVGVLRPGGGNTQPDVVVGAGPGGGPAVKVYDGAALASGDQATIDNAIAHPLRSFFAYGSLFRGGAYVTIGDVNGAADPADPSGTTPEMDIITGAGPGGGPHVKVFDFNAQTVLYSFMAYDQSFGGGVSVGAGNVGGDNGNQPGPPLASDEIITGAGPGGGPQVKAWAVNRTDFTKLDVVSNFFAFAPTFHGGIFVASGNYTENVDGNINDPATHHYDDILTGAGPGGQSQVKVWRLDNGQGPAANLFEFVPAATFSAYGSGVNVAVHVGTVADLNGDGLDDFITGAGAGGGPHAIVFGSKAFIDSNGDPTDLATYNPPILQQQMAYDTSYTGGISVG